MGDSQQLFQAFADRYRAEGSADPRDYLSQADGADREELRALIEGFLERVPRRDWDRASYPGSLGERAVASATGAGRDEAGEPIDQGELAGTWPDLLPKLRHDASLKRSELVAKLADALGFPDRSDKVAVYYHRMEQGMLPSEGVSTRVLDALGQIVGAPAEALRRAGAGGVEAPGAAGGEVFARVAAADAADAASSVDPGSAEPDEVDRLFTEGD